MCEGPSSISGPIPSDVSLSPKYYKRPSSGENLTCCSFFQLVTLGVQFHVAHISCPFFSSWPFRRKPRQDLEPVVRACGSRSCPVPGMLQCSHPSAACTYRLQCQTHSGTRPERGRGRSSETGNYLSDPRSKSE